MTIYLSSTEILEVNKGFVGPDQLRDFGLLDAAVMRPQSSAFGADAFPSLHDKAAALLHGLARNHPFVDGNKRTAWAATAMFYLVNGQSLPVGADDVVRLMLGAAEGGCEVEDIAATLENWAQAHAQADDWMDTPPGLLGPGEVEERLISEDIQKVMHDLDDLLHAHGLLHDFRASFADFVASLNDAAVTFSEIIGSGIGVPAVVLQDLHRNRRHALSLDSSPAWAEWVNAHPLFVMLDAIESRHRPTTVPGRPKKTKLKRRWG